MTALALKHVGNIKDLLRTRLAPDAFAAWIAPLQVCGATLIAANRFNADFIRSNYGDVLREIGADVAAARPQLRVISNSPRVADVPAPGPRMDFADFVCSDANAFALAAVKKCAGGAAAFSPLVIHSASGSGKTMLLDLLRRNSAVRVVSITGSRFVSDFVRSIKSGGVFAWKDSLRACDLFIMDDIQVVAGKRASADEFLALLSDLMALKKTIVLASDIAPSQITGFDRRLISLLSSGLSVDLALPDKDVRAKILSRHGIPEGIAARIPANGHIVAGVVNKIAAWRELDCGDLSESVLEKLLGDVLEKQNTPLMSVKRMCAKLGVSFDDVSGPTRVKKIVFARQKIMFALKKSTCLTLSEIGRLVGGRDHASVLYAVSRIEKAIASDLLLSGELSDLVA